MPQDTATPPTDLDRLQRELQGNILRGYGGEYRCSRHLVLSVRDPAAARRALTSMRTGERSTPEITPAIRQPKAEGWRWCLNIAFAYAGLRALGVPRKYLATFPPEFREGMIGRAARLGDVGESAPKNWIGSLADPDQVHLVVTVHGWEPGDLDDISSQVLDLEGGEAFEPLTPALPDGQVLDPPGSKVRTVHFGYVDGISQPRFKGISDTRRQSVAVLPYAPLGAVLLGHPTALPRVRWRVPQPDVLGRNGSFNAFRVLRQHVRAFEEFIRHAAEVLDKDRSVPDCTPELVAAKLCGRWRNGPPLTLAPEPRRYDEDNDNAFDYQPYDADGTRCPIGSHIRRCNPRGAQIVQRAANRTRPIVRRGMPYGPPFTYDEPDDTPRGLLGNFLCASLSAQFEAMQYDWINLGLHHPTITGTHDPLNGPNDAVTSQFIWPREGAPPIVLPGLPRFVTTEGGAYLFLPSLPAIDWLAERR